MSVTIHRPRLCDARQIADVHLQSWNDAYAGVYPDWFIQQRPIEYRHGMWVAFLQDDLRPVVVSRKDSTFSGLVRYGRPSSFSGEQADVGEVHQLYVVPNCQGQGTGSALLAFAESELRSMGYASAVLSVTEGKELSLGFYEKHGWQQQGDVRHIDFGGFEIPLLHLAKKLYEEQG